MHNVQTLIADRFPGWFRPGVAFWSQRLMRAWARWSGLQALQEFLDAHRHLSGIALVESGLRHFDARYLVDDVERERIPQKGRVVIVANHPLGGLDALLLLKCIADIRPDVRIVANDLLSTLDGLQSLLLPVRIMGGQAARSDLEAIQRALDADQAVLVFPAGSVSRLGRRGVADSPWQKSFLSFAIKTGAPVLPVHISGRNSAAFYAASMLARPLGTALLPREMFRQRRLRARIRIDHPLQRKDLAELGKSKHNVAQQIRAAVHALPNAGADWALPARPEALRHLPNLRVTLRELDDLKVLGRTPDGKRILEGRLDPSSALMRELAVARERSFRAAGEGTGRSADTDRFDAHYDQILLWDDQRHQLVGGYRVARCAQVLGDHGPSGLYTSTLFHFAPDWLSGLADAMELGRSFVVPEYWGGRSLDYLWLGIGAYIRQYPHIRQLFGPVSISADQPLLARRLMVAYYRRYFRGPSGLVRANEPFEPGIVDAVFRDLDQSAAETLLKQNLAVLGTRVPTLYKQYVDLCEPGGAQFLDFGTDPGFANAIDGLVRVDLNKVLPKKRARYLDSPVETASR